MTSGTISHYQILQKLGAGGMGEVYLAQDTKLDRKVALKILPADVAVHQDRMRRFVQEVGCFGAEPDADIPILIDAKKEREKPVAGTIFKNHQNPAKRKSAQPRSGCTDR
jgi:serine/threonine-protein kinase